MLVRENTVKKKLNKIGENQSARRARIEFLNGRDFYVFGYM